MKRICAFLLASIISGSAFALESKVVVSINPIHSIVASVMEGIEAPELLIKGVNSVHGYQTKPSDARLLESANVIVWIGATMESTLIASISNVSEETTVIEIGKMHGLQLYETRESPEGGHGDEHAMEESEDDHGDEESDDHGKEEGEDDHGDEESDDHGKEEDEDDHGDEEGDDHGKEEEEDDHGDEEGDDHGKEEEEDDHGDEEGDDHGKEEEEDDHGDEDDHGEEEEHGHEHGRYDMHVWLDINNAKVITEELTEHLAEIFPQHKAQLTSNMNKNLEKLDTLEAELRSLSESFSDSPYVVFHDAYQYLEKMLGLNNVGTVTVNPERAAGARRLMELRETISETGASCVFKEPQFNPSALEIIAEGTDLEIGTLDPLGADVEPGPNAYFEIMRDMVTALKDCLG